MEELAREQGVWSARADLCMFGLTTTKDGTEGPAMKPTRFLTNSWCLSEALNVKCDQSHVHTDL